MGCTHLERAVAGDISDVRELVLSGGARDLATKLVGATITGKVWQGAGPASSLSGTLIDAARRLVSLSLGGVGGWLATAPVGKYNVEIEVAFLDGSSWTFPSGAPMQLEVRASG